MHSIRLCHWDVWCPGCDQLPVLQWFCPESRWVKPHAHTYTNTHTSTHKWSGCLTYGTGHYPAVHQGSVRVSWVKLYGRKRITERVFLQEARHSETWSSRFHCVGYPVGSLWQEPLFNHSIARCTQCHPVCSLWVCKVSVLACLAVHLLPKHSALCLCEQVPVNTGRRKSSTRFT